MEVPQVLRSGDHGKVAAWRARQAEERTRRVRPDLYDQWVRTQAQEGEAPAD
jgi:tRNA (guanine-N1)-methyltransferase